MKATTSLATSCRRLLLWGVLTLQCLFSTAQKRFTADVEQQAEKILSQMTLDEKLSYIGGINWMYTRPLERFRHPPTEDERWPTRAGNTRALYCLSVCTDAGCHLERTIGYGIRKRPG